MGINHVLVVVSRESTTHTELCMSPSAGIILGPAESGSVWFVDRLQRVWNNVLLLRFFFQVRYSQYYEMMLNNIVLHLPVLYNPWTS